VGFISLVFNDYSLRNANFINHSKRIVISFYSLNMITISQTQGITFSLFIAPSQWVTLTWVNTELEQGVKRGSITDTV